MLHTICGSGMTLRLIRPICPFNCFLFRVDSLYRLRLNGGILQIICSLTNHINSFDFISTLAVAFFSFSGLPAGDGEACLSSCDRQRRRRKGRKKKKKNVFEAPQNLKTRMRWARVGSEQHFFLAERTRLGTIVSLSRGGYILLVYTCTQSWKFN